MTLKRNIIAGWLAHGVTLVIGFVLMPYILGVLGDSQYGAWLLVNAIAGYSGLVYAGFGATICRYVADLSARQEWQRLNQVASSIQAVYYISACIVLVLATLFAVAAPTFNTWGNTPIQDVQIAILLIGLTLAMGMVCSVYGGVLIGTQRIDIKRGIDVTLGICRLGMVMLLLRQEHGLTTLATIFLVITFLEQSLFYYFSKRQLPQLSISPQHIRIPVLKECFGFSLFNAVAQVAEQLIYFTDTIVIGFVLGPVAVIPYQIALRVAQMVHVPIAQIAEAILPKAGELNASASTGGLCQLLSKGMGLAFLLATSTFIGACYFGPLLMETWIGKLYQDSPMVLCILLGAMTISLPMQVVRKLLLGMGDVKTSAFIDITEASLNLGLSLILVHSLGVIGVAWGTLIPVVLIESLVLLPYTMRKLKLPLCPFVWSVIGPQLIPLSIVFIYCYLASQFHYDSTWLSIAIVGTGGGLATACGLVRLMQPARVPTSTPEVHLTPTPTT